MPSFVFKTPEISRRNFFQQWCAKIIGKTALDQKKLVTQKKD